MTESAGPASSREEQVLDILDAFDEGFCAFDHDWRITYANRAASAYAGVRLEDALGQIYWEVVPVAVGGELERVLRRAMQSGEGIEADINSTVRPGATFALRAFPIRGGLGISFRDVTGRHEQIRRDREQATRLELALDAAGLGDWSWDMASDLITFSPSAAAIFGIQPGPLITWAALLERLNDVDREATRLAVIAATEGLSDYEVEYRVRPPGLDKEVWVLSRGKVQFDAAGAPSGMIGVVADITLAKTREAMIRESEARFRMMADGAPAPVWVTGANGPIEFINEAFVEFAGRPREALLGDRWISILHPDDIPGMIAARAKARGAPHPESYTVEARFRAADGSWRWMQAISRPRFDADGVFQGYVGIAMDLTDIRAAEARQALMINELNHRVKNTLATIQSLASQTARLSATKEEFKDKFLARLMALNAAHNRLTQSAWDWTGLADLAGDQLSLHGAGERIVADGPDLRVPPKAALSLSLALHELATNAVKHGALQGDVGRVVLTWSVRDAHASSDAPPEAEPPRMIDLQWREEGGPPVTPPDGKGFGSRLLEAVGRDLGGEARLDYAPGGLVWTASFPAAG